MYFEISLGAVVSLTIIYIFYIIHNLLLVITTLKDEQKQLKSKIDKAQAKERREILSIVQNLIQEALIEKLNLDEEEKKEEEEVPTIDKRFEGMVEKMNQMKVEFLSHFDHLNTVVANFEKPKSESSLEIIQTKVNEVNKHYLDKYSEMNKKILNLKMTVETFMKLMKPVEDIQQMKQKLLEHADMIGKLKGDLQPSQEIQYMKQTLLEHTDIIGKLKGDLQPSQDIKTTVDKLKEVLDTLNDAFNRYKEDNTTIERHRLRKIIAFEAHMTKEMEDIQDHSAYLTSEVLKLMNKVFQKVE